MLIAGAKHETSYLLRTCAESLGFQHPISACVEDEPTLNKLAKDIEDARRQGVLKRSYSARSLHVITPRTIKPTKVLKKALQEQKRDWPQEKTGFIPKPMWFFQPYLPLLLHLGELRSFIVNGVLYYTVSTVTSEPNNPAALQICHAHIIRPLSAFKSVTLCICYV